MTTSVSGPLVSYNNFNMDYFKSVLCLTLLSTTMMSNVATLPSEGNQRNTAENAVNIGDRKYTKEKISQLDQLSSIEYMSMNSAGDIYVWYGYKPKILKAGWDEPQDVEGIKNKIIRGFVIDSKDNLFFIRTFEGLFVVQPGVEERSLGVHITIVSIHIDNADTIYIGSYGALYKIDLEYNEAGLIVSASDEQVKEMDGIMVPSGVLANGDIYFRESFFYFFYRNLEKGKSSQRKIEEIGKEDGLGAAVDLNGNSYVATKRGLLYLPKDNEGQVVKHVQAFGEKQVNCVWVNWRTGHILVAMEDEGVYKLTPTL